MIPVQVEHRVLTAKSAINKYKRRDNWFWAKYSINPYKGCQHSCRYCDAQSGKYLVREDAEDYSKVIYVKGNIGELLEKELSASIRKRPLQRDVVVLSGGTDPYQQAEESYKVTRKVLTILRDHSFPVHIITKSDLVLRDIDILSEIADTTWCSVSFTITTVDQSLYSRLEPKAPEPEQRLKALRLIAQSNIQTGVLLYPIIPYLGDHKENIESVIEKAAACGSRYVLPMAGLTLRNDQKPRFYRLLSMYWPDLTKKYVQLYRNSQYPRRDYTLSMSKMTSTLCKKYGVLNYIPPPDFPTQHRENLRVSTLLLLIAYLIFQTDPLPYKMRAYLNAAYNIEMLECNIREIYEKQALRDIEGIGEGIAHVISEYLTTGKCQKVEEMGACA